MPNFIVLIIILVFTKVVVAHLDLRLASNSASPRLVFETLQQLKAGCVLFPHLEDGVRHWSDASTDWSVAAPSRLQDWLLAPWPRCSQRLQTAQLVFAPLSLPFSGSGTFHMLIQVLVGRAQPFSLCLFSVCIFKGTGLLLGSLSDECLIPGICWISEPSAGLPLGSQIAC